jgi:hypothetical protein
LPGGAAETGVDVWTSPPNGGAGGDEPEAILAGAGVQVPRFSESAPAGWELLKLLASQVLEPLAERFPAARLGFRPGRLHAVGYYRGASFNIDAELSGREYSVADGGTVTGRSGCCPTGGNGCS